MNWFRNPETSNPTKIFVPGYSTIVAATIVPAKMTDLKLHE